MKQCLYVCLIYSALAGNPAMVAGGSNVAFSVQDMPSEELISAVFQQARNAAHPVIENLDSEIKTKEIDYTKDWMHMAIHYYLIGASYESQFKFISDFGPHHDDAITIDWKWNTLDVTDRKWSSLNITVVDTRLLFVVADMRERTKWDVESAYKEIVNWPFYERREDTEIHVERLVFQNETTLGRIVVNTDNPEAWFIKPVMWAVKDNKICFIFDKNRSLPVSKIPPRDATEFVGGIPVSDPRQ